jgi:hypothetical protein
MRIPYGLTEEQVKAVIERVIKILAPSFVFGYFTIDDMRQEAWIGAINGLEKYDGRKQRKVKCREERLTRFLSVHIRNCLLNVQRKYYFRYEKPKSESRVAEWEKNNQSRRNLMHTWDLDDVPEYMLSCRTDFEKDFDDREWLAYVESQMTDAVRNDFRRMCEGVVISNVRKEAVQLAVSNILDAEKE